MQPIATLVIPMHNEARRVGKCLDSILASSYRLDLCEIIAVDNGSTDASANIADEKLKGLPNARVLRLTTTNVAVGLNRALRMAEGRFLVRMDAHCEYSRDYLKNCLMELSLRGAGNVGGVLTTLPGSETWVARAIALVSAHPVGVGWSEFRLGLGDRFVDTVPFGAFRTRTLRALGGYNEALARNQDYELNSRIRAAGEQIYLSTAVHVKYYNSTCLRNFLLQALRNGRGAALSWKANSGSFSMRHAAPVAFVSLVTLAAWVSAFSSGARLVLMTIVMLYLAPLLYCGLELAARHNWRHFFLVPAILLLYQIAYGVGTLLQYFELAVRAGGEVRELVAGGQEEAGD